MLNNRNYYNSNEIIFARIYNITKVYFVAKILERFNLIDLSESMVYFL